MVCAAFPSIRPTSWRTTHSRPALAALPVFCRILRRGWISKRVCDLSAGGFCFVPDELLAEKSLRGGLSAFVGTELSFVGISEPFTVAAGDEAPHDLTVLIPKSDYDRALLKSRLEAAGVLMLLLFFAVSCCLFYTRRYLRPHPAGH